MHNSDAHLVEHYSHLTNFNRDFRNANLFRLVATLVTGKSVVDIGCGAGFFLGMLAGEKRTLMGIEPNEGMRALAHTLNPQIKVVSGSAEDIGTLITTPVECITMLDVLEHVKDDSAQVQRTWSALSPGGEFIIVVPAYPFLYGERDKNMGHYRRYSKQALETVLTANGFVVESMRYWNTLGVLPYAVSEKILHRPLRVRLREEAEGGVLRTFLQKVLHFWVREFENRFSIGFGLSIICVAKKV